ncbi:MAG TPA: DUF4142 domain-containing protein [Vineibacter sp.]|nr:DUF4142 domain-containing protein [Vineibacter sp.]
MAARLMMRRDAFLTIALMAGAAVACRSVPALAQSMDQTGGTTRFVKLAAHTSEFEVAAGQLAQQRTTNAAVRGFAERMVKDHGELLTTLKAVNDANASAPLPRGPDDDGRQRIARLGAASGAEFDVMYMEMQIASLEPLLAALREYSRVGSVESLKSRYSVRYTPVVEEHLRMARTVRGGLTS